MKTLRARERIPDIRPANARFDGQFEIPTLEEILALVRGAGLQRAARAAQLRAAAPAPIGIYPETKHPSYFASLGLAMEAPLLEVLERHGHAGRTAPVWLQSFEVGNLKALSRMTELPLVQLIEAAGRPFDWAAAGVSQGYADMLTPAGLAAIAGYAQAIGPNKSLVIARRADETLGEPSALVSPRAPLRRHPRSAGLYSLTARLYNRTCLIFVLTLIFSVELAKALHDRHDNINWHDLEKIAAKADR